MIAFAGLCVVAMYLGRFMRFNSWDVLFAPGAVLESVIGVPRPTTLVVLIAMFVVVGAGTCVTGGGSERFAAATSTPSLASAATGRSSGGPVGFTPSHG